MRERHIEEIRARLAGEERFYLLLARRRYEELGRTAPILMTQGDDLLISNREDP